ncbi:hypothetical protein E5163_14935 [Marinicauda algicola]|uniref:DUF7936 domain-containing protein n=1 Tax=Marinicauda algicola TaxID=2029849 RepID=A0A4S2GWY7_9PROT|nr:hypothetical protein [Marinicauda algicola]TGY87361.1 hypothetical protein E5163_14935 [Marinicauda algicola]
MTITYSWTFSPQGKDRPDLSLTGVVTSFEVRVRATDEATGESAEVYYAIPLADPDPQNFTPFPSDPAETPAFEALLQGWALEHLGETADALEARALAQLDALQNRPQPLVLP